MMKTRVRLLVLLFSGVLTFFIFYVMYDEKPRNTDIKVRFTINYVIA